MTQAQAGMQECLVVFARSVEVLHQSPKARAIEVQERSPNVAPSWRGILAPDHGHEPFDEGFVSELLGSLKIHDFPREQIGGIDDARKAPFIEVTGYTDLYEVEVLVIFRLVIAAGPKWVSRVILPVPVTSVLTR